MTSAFDARPSFLGSFALAPSWKPLNKGYENFPEIFSRYANTSNLPHSPELGRGLEAFRTDSAAQLLRGVGQRPQCLIEGVSCPWNGASLRGFLSRIGVEEPTIHAIDIMDLELVARLLGFELPGLRFSVGDAAHLKDWQDRSVQLLVQDHLLNCAPHGMHRAIVSEAARVLDRDGVWILNFSVEPVLGSGRQTSLREFERLLGRPLNDRAYSLREAAPDSEIPDRAGPDLFGSLIMLDDLGRSILITPPHGNFEFYFHPADLECLLAEFDLRIVYQQSEQGMDQHGNRYHRHRTLVKHA